MSTCQTQSSSETLLPLPQTHVPTEEYEANISAMVDDLIGKFGIDKSKIVLITPPPVNRKMLEELGNQNGDETGDISVASAAQPVAYSNDVTSLYAAACRRVGESFDVTVLDLFSDILDCEDRASSEEDGEKTNLDDFKEDHSLMSVNEFVTSSSAESPQSEPLWHSFFCDGLHFSRNGSEFVFSRLWPLVEQRAVDLPFKYPHWKDVDEQDPKTSLQNVHVFDLDFKLD